MAALAVSSAASAQSNILVSDSNRVLRYEYAEFGGWSIIDAFVCDFFGTLDNSHGMAYGPDGHLYVASLDDDAILKYDGQSGKPLGTFVGSGAGGLNEPRGIAWGADGNLYVCSGATDSVLQFDGASGTPLAVFVSSGSAGLDDPYDLNFGPDGNLYVTGRLSNTINVYSVIDGSPVGDGIFADADSGGTLDGPVGFEWGSDGNLYVANIDDDDVLRFNGTTGEFIDVFASGAGMDAPIDVAFGPADGHLYVADRLSTPEVLKFDGQAGFFIEQVASGLSAANFIIFKPDSTGCAQDIDQDGTVGILDLLSLLGAWGDCPE